MLISMNIMLSIIIKLIMHDVLILWFIKVSKDQIDFLF